MDSYKNIINNIQKTLATAISGSNLDEENLINDFQIAIYNSVRASQNALNNYEEAITKNSLNLKALDKKNLEQHARITTIYNQKIKTITQASIDHISNIKELITEDENDKQSKINSFKEEKKLITSTTNPLIYNFLLKKNKKIDEYNLSKKAIKQRYNMLVSKFSIKRENENNLISSTSNKSLFRYNKANDNIIETLKEKCKDFEFKKDSLIQELEHIKQKHDRDILKLEKEYNDDIIELNKKLNISLNLNKNQYELEFESYESELALFLENEAQNRSIIVKSFISDLESINSKIEFINERTKTHSDYYTRKYHYMLFNINKEINNYYKEGTENKLEIKTLLTKIRDTTSKLNSILDSIKSFQKRKLNELQNKKQISERIKNNEILKINNLIDSKTFEINIKKEILKNSIDVNKQILNDENDKLAFEKRSEYDCRKHEIEREFKKAKSNINKELYNIMWNINSVNEEIEFTEKMEIQIEENESRILNSKIERNNINILLEIEKNNFLKQYNFEYIDNLIKREEATYNFEEQNAFLSRDKRNELLDINISKAKYDTKHNKALFSLDIESQILNENKLKRKSSYEYNNSISIIKLQNTLSHFQIIKDKISAEHEVLRKVIMPLINTLSNFIKDIITTSSLDTEYKEKYRNLYKKVLYITNETIIDLISVTKENISIIINEQINYETSAKYNNLQETLLYRYEAEVENIVERKKSLENTILNYNNAIKQFYQNIVLIENNRTIITNNLNKGLIGKYEAKRKLKQLKKDFRYNHRIIDKNENQIDLLTKEKKEIPQKLVILKHRFIINKSKLNHSKKEEASLLFDAQDTLNNYFDDLVSNINYISTYCSKVYTKDKQFIKDCSQIIKFYQKASYETTKKYIDFINKLSNSFNKKYESLTTNNHRLFLNNLHSLEKENIKLAYKVTEKINEENNNYSINVKSIKDQIEKVISKYNKLNQSNLFNFKTICNNINQNNNNLKEQFYKNILSTDYNLHENITLHNNNNNNLTKENREKINNLIHLYQNKKQVGYDNMIIKQKQTDDLILYYGFECKEKIKTTQDNAQKYKLEYNLGKRNKKIALSRQSRSKTRTIQNYLLKRNREYIKYTKIIEKCRRLL